MSARLADTETGTDVNKNPAGTPTQRHHSDRNHGRRITHTGGQYDSHLLVPVIPSA